MRFVTKNSNHEMITWARDKSGHSIDAVARHLRISNDDYLKLENGSAKPTIVQLKAIAKKVKRPLGVFYLPQPPSEKPKPKKDFRSKSEDGYSPKLVTSIRRAGFIQEKFSLLYPEDSKNTYWEVSRSISRSAEMARDWMGLTDQQQTANRDVRGFLQLLIQKLESKGVLVLIHSFSAEEAKAYSIHGSPGVVVLTSNDRFLGSRVFSILHELYHLANNESGICFTNEYSKYKRERACDKFAAEFLMPERLLENIQKNYTSGKPIDSDNLKIVSEYLKTSQYALLIRLLETGRITQKEFNSKKAEWENIPKSKQKGGPGQTKIDLTLKANGQLFTSKIYSSFQNGEFSVSDAAYFLGVNQGYINEVGDKVAER